MGASVDQLTTQRLTLRQWRDDDRAAFALMNADPEVMEDSGGPVNRAASDRKLDRFVEAFDRYGYGRWVVEGSLNGGEPEFLGYTGVMPNRGEHPLGRHDDIGWRLRRKAWGCGFASEAAAASLHDAFTRVGLDKIYSYTARDNLRSQAVMERIGLRREESLDFQFHYDGYGLWNGLVWLGTREDSL